MQIRNMQENDIPILQSLEDPILSANAMYQDLQNPSFTYYLLEDKEIIGYIAFSHVIDTMDIIAISIRQAYRMRGYASLLLTEVISYAKQNNITSILLEVRESNTAAIHLYQQHGFQQLSRRPHYYHNPDETALLLGLVP